MDVDAVTDKGKGKYDKYGKGDGKNDYKGKYGKNDYKGKYGQDYSKGKYGNGKGDYKGRGKDKGKGHSVVVRLRRPRRLEM